LSADRRAGDGDGKGGGVMDKIEIEKMTADELRLAIAKAKGWQIYHYDKDIAENCYYLLVDNDFDAVIPFNYHKTEAECWEKDCPTWPTSIPDAWELVEEMGHLCWTVTIENLPSKPQEVVCRVFKPYIAGRINAYADTVPLAICRAWLIWKSEQA
jgi:hypothetical protein